LAGRALLGTRAEPAVEEVHLRRALESDEISGQMPQAKNLLPGESLQIREDCYGLLPVVAHPGERLCGARSYVT